MVPPFVNNPLDEPADDADHHHFSPEDLHALLGTLDGASDTTVTAAATATDTKQEIDADAKAQARTERKRSREKQRRSDVNKQFHELTATLRSIEGECEPSLLANANLYSSTTNRADLIARTITLLKNLHQSHKKQKTENERLQQELETSKQVNEETAQKLKDSMMAPHNVGGGKMMMMVPVMMNSDASGSGGFMPFMPGASVPAASSPHTADATNDRAVQQSWGMMPPWMNMMMVPPAPPVPDRKQAPKSSSQSTESGNLAHCA